MKPHHVHFLSCMGQSSGEQTTVLMSQSWAGDSGAGGMRSQLHWNVCRKLMGRRVGLADLAEVHPEVHRSLVELLAMPGDGVADLALVFQARQTPNSDRVACVCPES